MRRALVMMTGTSVLAPLIGLATAPILAQALGVDGRGAVAAALAPQAIVVVVAMLGLPEALTYHVARRPALVRRALAWGVAVTAVLGAGCAVAVYSFRGFLSAGDEALARLIVIATLLAIPQLVIGLLRGAATGRQMWRAVAVERISGSALRLVALGSLALAGELDVQVAVVTLSLVPVVSGVTYWRVLFGIPVAADAGTGRVVPALMSFASRTWLGSIASMLTGRLAQLFVTPLAGTEQLGLLVVAITISDVTYIVATAVRDALFGVTSRVDDRQRLLSVSRVTCVTGAVGSLLLGSTVPFWIGWLFGAGFTGAVTATWLFLLAAVANIPGLMAGAALAAWDRPGLRSAALAVALVTNFGAFLVLVPPLGAAGAGIAGVISAVAVSGFSVVAAARTAGVPASAFCVPRRSDVALVVAELRHARSRVRPGARGPR